MSAVAYNKLASSHSRTRNEERCEGKNERDVGYNEQNPRVVQRFTFHRCQECWHGNNAFIPRIIVAPLARGTWPLCLTIGCTKNSPEDHCHDVRKWYKKRVFCNPRAVIVSWLPWFQVALLHDADLHGMRAVSCQSLRYATIDRNKDDGRANHEDQNFGAMESMF
ncbi:hypothetical protein F1880_009916 [Penicillium rolfsii]|nr:hypothetical protein F1880_009916 [Penicillium rolfsii]